MTSYVNTHEKNTSVGTWTELPLVEVSHFFLHSSIAKRVFRYNFTGRNRRKYKYGETFYQAIKKSEGEGPQMNVTVDVGGE